MYLILVASLVVFGKVFLRKLAYAEIHISLFREMIHD